tara:strand:- start:410 stop:907 length:498 start_codon:yes stop_codon:yes gene_type:complete
MRTAATLFDEEMVIDRRSAGECAQKNGALFENYVHNELSNYNITIEREPHFYCHFGLPRRGDFLITTNDAQIHIECKQLGNVQSHFDKLSHCLMNLVSGCYGNHFWLVYDYAKDSKKGAHKKINWLKLEAERRKKQVALQGINFELVHIEDIPAVMKAYSIQKRY